MPLDTATLDACYRRLERPLYNVLYRWLWQPQACQDVMHDCFLRLWEQRGRIDIARLDALVYATALNLAKNRLRWQRLRQFVGLEDAPLTVAGDGERAVDAVRLRRALDRLSDDERNVLLLSEFAGFDTAEIAEALAIAPGTVGSRKHRAVARLRAMLEEGP